MEKIGNEELRKSLETIVFAFSETLEYGDPFTAVHQSQVTRLACKIAEEMGLPAERITGLRVGGIVHDVGKIRIPPEILINPNPLSEVEKNMLRSHPQLGYDILAEVKFPWPVKEIVLQHHERINGSGYPKGLSGGEIALEARIITVADVMEAMASERPYRPGLGLDKAREEIIKNRGVLYETEAVNACLKLFDKGFRLKTT